MGINVYIYAIRLNANPSDPAHEASFPPNHVNLYEQKPKAMYSFSIRISPLLESTNIKPRNIEKTFYTKHSSLMPRNTFRLTLWKNVNQIHTY